MKKPVLEEMLKEKGFTFKEDDDFEKISEAICATANHYSTQIMGCDWKYSKHGYASDYRCVTTTYKSDGKNRSETQIHG